MIDTADIKRDGVVATSFDVALGKYNQSRAVSSPYEHLVDLATALEGVLIGAENEGEGLTLRLLDLDEHPSMTFASTSITVNGERWEVTGELTARGTTVSLTGTVTVSTIDTQPVVLTARTQLDRRALGIRVPGFMIGRWVDILVVAAVQPASSRSQGFRSGPGQLPARDRRRPAKDYNSSRGLSAYSSCSVVRTSWSVGH